MLIQFSLSELPAVAPQFWQLAGDAKVFAFFGEMGAGKTTIIEALCRQKGVKGVMGSPTFSIINEYAYQENEDEKIIYHIDLYRLKDEQEIIEAGVEDCIYSGHICFVEWPEKAPSLLHENTVRVYIETLSPDVRSLKMGLPSAV